MIREKQRIRSKEARAMAKSESEKEVLSRKEMKGTKGGAGAAAAASEALKGPIIEERTLQAEADLPASQPAASVTPSPSAQEDLMRTRKR